MDKNPLLSMFFSQKVFSLKKKKKVLFVHLLLESACFLLPFYSQRFVNFLLLSHAIQFACNTLPIANQILLSL